MGTLIYAAISSLDGYVADKEGRWDWSEPDEEVHSFVNDLERPIGTHLYGRRMYEVMRVWDSDEMLAGQPAAIREYAEIWCDADKVVYSSSLENVTTARTTIERRFEPDAVRELKRTSPRDLGIGGPGLAAHAIRAGLVDEIHLFLSPVLVGGGTRALPDDVSLRLELVDERRFGNGVVHLHHRVLSNQGLR